VIPNNIIPRGEKCDSEYILTGVTWKYTFSTPCITIQLLHCEPTKAHNFIEVTISQHTRLATGWTVGGLNPGGAEIFHTCPDWLWGPPSLLYNRYRVFPGVKQSGRGVDQPPPSSAEVKERAELYLYSTSGPSWPVTG